MTMFYLIVINISLVISVCGDISIFHERSKVTFYPDSLSDYFGFSVVLRNNSLLVGAPKAISRLKPTTSPGLVFSCRFTSLEQRNVTCYPLGMDEDSREISNRKVTERNFFRNDMWFGATIAAIPNDRIMVCAPRWADPYKDKHLLANGACYVESKTRGLTLTPLKDQYRLAFKTDGNRKEYGEYGTHLNFYAYGQVGMSVKVTELNSVIIGAPGLLQWTGGIVDYRFNPDPNVASVFFNKQQVANPYYTKDLGPDDYFGYSVESGVFQLNGSALYVAGAPRSKMGYGQVLIFDPNIHEYEALNIKAKVKGPQLGSYFGASLCCIDINSDGRSDLLVGAPNFIRKDGGLPFDQGAVFVFLSGGEGRTLTLEEAGYVSGSGESGARFGTAMADLGDVDGDGFRDVAIGAPWENDGLGAVYIYRGSKKGLNSKYAQRIISVDARSFGISISKGVDVDGNNCNDLAIGAHASNTAYLYRCVPTIHIQASIKVPDAMNLPQNATNFTAVFCVNVPPMKNRAKVEIDLKASITVDPEEHRARISGDSVYTLIARPGNEVCDEQIVEVKPTADLSKPIPLKFDLETISLQDSTTFPKTAARLSEDSTLHSLFLIQLVRDCGEDLVCTPWLEMALEAVNRQYVPGSDDPLGVRLTIFNKEEPAYGAKIHLYLPPTVTPIRIPSSCNYEESNMTCEVPAPLPRGESVQWDIDLEYVPKTSGHKDIVIKAKLEDALYRRNVIAEAEKEVTVNVKPMASFSVIGKSLPNNSITVTRDTFYEGQNVSYVHRFEVTNLGPSDWPQLQALIEIPENVTLASPIKGCTEREYDIKCTWSIVAKASLPVMVLLRYDLAKYGKYLEETKFYNTTTLLTLFQKPYKRIATVSTVLILDPAEPFWPIVVGSIAGLLLLAFIVYGLYKYGFFSRERRDELKRLQEETISLPEDGASSSTMHPLSLDENYSTTELISDDSE